MFAARRALAPTRAATVAWRLASGAAARETRNPKDSWVQHRLKLSASAKLRGNYVNSFGGVRVGRVLELIDALAATSAHAHAGFTKEAAFVTASVDRIDLLAPMMIDKDVLLQGCCVWAGKSSMEIRVEVAHVEESGALTPLMLAAFTMVARRTPAPGQSPADCAAFVVPLLVPTSEREHSWHNEATLKRMQRSSTPRHGLALSGSRAITAPPSDEEQVHIASLWRKLAHARANPAAPIDWAFMRDSRYETTAIMHPQRQNTNRKIFGGYLMRSAFEIGYVTALMFGRGAPPVFRSSSDISFELPVEIGSVVQFASQVAFTGKSSIHTRIAAHVVDAQTGSRQTTNVFNMCYTVKPPEDGPPLRQIMPYSYEDAMLMLDARRRYLAFAAQREQRKATSYDVTTAEHMPHPAVPLDSRILPPDVQTEVQSV